ncbi:hypothetical protein [Thiobacter aerophilum]|uniref:Uncharacterized protein n=1 Tax=Thiobacter aerophilum TaxID=3121275 RepID=A0ABV0EFM3_9BURK
MKYLYTGPLTSLTLQGQDVILRPGGVVDLPDCEVTETLKALGRIAPVAEPNPTSKPKGE